MTKVDELTVGVKLVDAESTEVICRATDCIHNMAHDPVNPYAGCRMKSVYLVDGGKCNHYEEYTGGDRFRKYENNRHKESVETTTSVRKDEPSIAQNQ